MKASEGKIGRVFMVWLEEGEDATEAIGRFANEKGIAAAQVFSVGGKGWVGFLTPDAEGRPGLMLPAGAEKTPPGGEIVIQEVTGINFRRVRDPQSGMEMLAQMPSTKTRVMERPAPAPEEAGPGTIPVYLFNAEFN